MAKNSNLTNAKRLKNDEFFTRWSDIENELIHYENQLRGKSVICNCDDIERSNFIEYLCRQAPYIGITKVIGVRYEGPDATESWYVTYTPPEDIENYDADNWKDYLIKTRMTGNGGFETPESIELLDQCDVCITNPPFSRFRDFVKLLIDHNKLFLIIGSFNAIAYKEIFELIKENKIWTGYKSFSGGMDMIVPSDFDASKCKKYRIEDGNYIVNIMGCIWYTNIDIQKRHDPLQLVFSMERHDKPYKKYKNYDAYNVDKVSDIPYDSEDKILGVPITFIGSFCVELFEIIGNTANDTCDKLECFHQVSDEIQNQLVGGNKWMTILYNEENNTYYYTYRRILIRRRQEEN